MHNKFVYQGRLNIDILQLRIGRNIKGIKKTCFSKIYVDSRIWPKLHITSQAMCMSTKLF